MLSLDPKKQYVPLSVLDSVLKQLGYHEEILIPGGGFYYVKADQSVRPHLPYSISLCYPTIAVDGTLWFPKEYIFDLFDRLSDIDPEDGVLIRAIRKLDS
jgi:hypothetical protein